MVFLLLDVGTYFGTVRQNYLRLDERLCNLV